MSESIFEKLLGSYSGMRKRTWTPSVIEESNSFWKQQFSLKSKVEDPQARVAQYNAAKASIQKAQGEAATSQITAQQATQQLAGQPYGSAVGRQNGISVVNGLNQPMGISLQKVPNAIQALDDLMAADEGEKSKKPEEKPKGEKDKEEPANLAPVERVEFSEDDRVKNSEFIERALGVEPTEAMRILTGIESTINNPKARTKLKKFEDFLERESPELVPEAKKQFMSAVNAMFSVANKVKTDSATGRSYINSEDLTTSEREALKVITVRSKGVIAFGRPEERVEDYALLQESAALGDANYGFPLGKLVDQLAPSLSGVRVVEGSANVESMTDDEFNDLSTAFQGSKATGSSGNDAKGKLKEKVSFLARALKSGDKKLVKEAKEDMVKGLEALGVAASNLDSLETTITTETFDDLDEIHEQMRRQGAKVALLNIVKSAVGSTDAIEAAMGLQEGDVVKVAMPSQSSKMGDRPDIITFIRGDAKIDMNAFPPGTKLHTVTADDTELVEKYGEEIIGTKVDACSVKVQKDDNSDIVAGAAGISRMMTKDIEEYDELHSSRLDDLVQRGAMTEEQRKQCEASLEKDREMYKEAESMVNSLNSENRKDLDSFFDVLSPEGLSEEGKKKFNEEKDRIMEGINSDNPEMKRQAAYRIYQLKRMQASAGRGGDQYIRGSMFNESVLGFASKMEETISVETPEGTYLGSNHTMHAEMAKAIFDSGSTVNISPARTTVSTKEDGNLFKFRRVARKNKNLQVETEIAPAAKKFLKKL